MPKAGRHFTKVTPNRSAPQFADYLLEIVTAYPEADTIHLVMDNLSSHRRKALVDRYRERIGGLLWNRLRCPLEQSLPRVQLHIMPFGETPQDGKHPLHGDSLLLRPRFL